MASITLNFTHPLQTLEKTVTLPDAHLERLIAAYKSYYVRKGVFDPNPPNSVVFDKIMTDMLRTWRDQTLNEEKYLDAAASGITPISV